MQDVIDDLADGFGGLDDPTVAGSKPVDAGRKDVGREEAGTTSSRSTSAMPSVGSAVGEYIILGEIARGAMGVVYRAHHDTLGRVVALKMVIDGDSAGEELRQRFANEAKAAAGLDHPGIVPVFDVGQWNGFPYFTMGFVDGDSLAAVLHSGPLAPRKAAVIAKQVADAIQHAHLHSIIHRDVKPANILIDAAGDVRVTDFGVSKILNAANELTQQGELIGTPHFMPPEQAGDSAQPIGPASDVYSIGAVLYAMLTGRPPFQAASPLDVVAQVISHEPVPPSALNASVPIELEVVAMKCLSKRIADRYQSASDLSDDLTRFLNGQPILARPPGMLQKTRLLFRKHVVFASVSGTASLLLVILTAALFLSWIGAQRKVADLTNQRDAAQLQLQSERRMAEKYIAVQSASDPSDLLIGFQVRRLAESSLSQSDTNPDLALQLAIASVELAEKNDQTPPKQVVEWLRTQVLSRYEDSSEQSPTLDNAQSITNAATALIVAPLDESQRQLFGIEQAPFVESDTENE